MNTGRLALGRPAKHKATKKAAKAKEPLPKARHLVRDSWSEIVVFWRSLAAIIGVYVALFFLVTQGLALNLSVSGIRDDITRILGEDASWWTRGSNLFLETLLGNQLQPRDTATSFLQLLLGILTALAIIWTLRRTRELQRVSLRDAFYKGTAAFVPFSMVLLLLVLVSLPLSISSIFFAAALQYGSLTVTIVAGVVNLLVLGLTVYWYVCLWPSLYIASLGDIYPLQALGNARHITRYRRWPIVWRMLVLVVMLLLYVFGVLLLVALAVPFLTLLALVFLTFSAYLFAITYMYMLYRSLL